MALPSPVGDGAAESYWQWRCRSHLVAVQCSCQVMLMTALSSHAGDGIAESCWRPRCRGDVGHDAMSLLRQLGRDAMSLPSHADDVAAEASWPWHDVSAESCCATEVEIYDQSRDVRPQSGCTSIISMYNG
jgi:hypothetical protein